MRTLLHDEGCDDAGSADEKHADDPPAKSGFHRLVGHAAGPARNSPTAAIDLCLDRSTRYTRCVLRVPPHPPNPVAGGGDHGFCCDGKMEVDVSHCVDAFAGAAAHGLGKMLAGGDGFREVDAHTHALFIPRGGRVRNAATASRKFQRSDVCICRIWEHPAEPHPAAIHRRDTAMRLGVSIFFLAVGAILAFAVTKTVSGIDLVTVGWILMGVGALGVLLSLLFWSSFSPYRREQTVVVDRGIDLNRPV